MNMNKKKLDFNDISDKGKELYYKTQELEQKSDFMYSYYRDMLTFMDNALDELNYMNRKMYGMQKTIENYREKEYKYRRTL